MAVTTPTDSYGFYIAKADGSEARRYLKMSLPRELPDTEAEEVVAKFQMDEGENHPGYLVSYHRKVDISNKVFPIVLGKVSEEDKMWMEGLRDDGEVVLISWKAGMKVLATFDQGGLKLYNYALNLREFGRVELRFLLKGLSSASFSLYSPPES